MGHNSLDAKSSLNLEKPRNAQDLEIMFSYFNVLYYNIQGSLKGRDGLSKFWLQHLDYKTIHIRQHKLLLPTLPMI